MVSLETFQVITSKAILEEKGIVQEVLEGFVTSNKELMLVQDEYLVVISTQVFMNLKPILELFDEHDFSEHDNIHWCDYSIFFRGKPVNFHASTWLDRSIGVISHKHDDCKERPHLEMFFGKEDEEYLKKINEVK